MMAFSQQTHLYFLKKTPVQRTFFAYESFFPARRIFSGIAQWHYPEIGLIVWFEWSKTLLGLKSIFASEA